MQYLIKNIKAIVSCDEDDRVYYNTDILTKDNQILLIDKEISCEDAKIIDGTDKFMYPGLINTHHHFFQSFIRNLTTIDRPNMSVMKWLESVQSSFSMVTDDVVYYASLTAMADLIKHGCTTAYDQHYLFMPGYCDDPIARQIEAASLIGMRFIAGRGGSTLPMSEGSFIPDSMCESTDTFLTDCERLIDKYHDPLPMSMQQVIISPTQPVSSKFETFVEAAKLARYKNTRMHTHLCEGEVETMLERWGMRSIEWCEKAGFIGPDVWIAHGRQTLPWEYPILASYETGISHCPAPTLYGATEILDIPAMQEAGILISLGCDGSSTNEGSSMLDALRLAYLMQTFRNKDRTGCPSPYDMLKIATVNGARTLGRPEIGMIKSGMAADLFMIDVSTLEFAGALHDPKNIIPKLGITGPVWMTMINGKLVFMDGVLCNVNEHKLAKEGEFVCNRDLRSKCDVFLQLEI
ncbi:MAG: amidohydrolase [Eubacteriales bacterium]|nr:amidohydrolase [Eubacteriales bacterium]